MKNIYFPKQKNNKIKQCWRWVLKVPCKRNHWVIRPSHVTSFIWSFNVSPCPSTSCRYLFLRVSGPHGHQSAGDGHHHQCAPPQLQEISRGPTLGEGGGPQTHSQPHLLPLAGGRRAPVCAAGGQTWGPQRQLGPVGHPTGQPGPGPAPSRQRRYSNRPSERRTRFDPSLLPDEGPKWPYLWKLEVTYKQTKSIKQTYSMNVESRMTSYLVFIYT